MSGAFQQHKSSDEPVPGYRLVRFLGKGNFGEVWLASAPGNKKVALKIIDLRGREGLQESKAIEGIKDINHPHLVSIFAYWIIDADGSVLDDQLISQLSPGNPGQRDASGPIGTLLVESGSRPRPVELIVAMSLGAKNLSDLLEEHRRQDEPGIPVDALLEYMEDAAKGIDYLNSPIHDLGKGPLAIIHGDIKPQNLLIVGDSVQICDFGLARGIDELRKTATAMGSFAYAAPELLEGHPHVRSDQYCLAVSYIELRTGDLPLFGETNILKIAEIHRSGRLDLSGLGRSESEVIRKATNPDPLLRWPSCREMVRQLRAAVELDAADQPLRNVVSRVRPGDTRKLASSGTTPARPQSRLAARRLVFAAALVLIVAGFSAAALWWDRWWKPADKGGVKPEIAKKEVPSPTVEEKKPAKTDRVEQSPVVVPPEKTSAERPKEKAVAKKPVEPPVDYSRLVQRRLEDALSWSQRTLKPLAGSGLGLLLGNSATASGTSPAKKVAPEEKVEPPLVALLIADARDAYLNGQFTVAGKKLKAARDRLESSPNAEQLRQVAQWTAAISLSEPKDGDLDVAIADARVANASDLLADALGRRATRQASRELIVADLSAAIGAGTKSKTAYGQAALSRAYILRANYDNRPAYNQEARDRDLRDAVAGLKRAADVAIPGPDGYLYHFTAARAHEDLAWLLERNPAAQMNQAIREFAKAAAANPQSPRPLCGIGLCYYHARADIFLPPSDLQKLGGGPLYDEFQAADECERAFRAASVRDPQLIDVPDYLARLDYLRAVAYYDRYLDGGGNEDLLKAKQCSARADEQLQAARDLAQKQGLRNSEEYAVRWAMFPLSDIRYRAEKAQGAKQRRAELRTRFDLLEKMIASSRETKRGHKATILLRGRLAESENQYAEALKIYSDALPQDLAKAGEDDARLLLARAACRLTIAAGGMPESARWNSDSIGFDSGKVTQQQIHEAQEAINDAIAAGGAAYFIKDRIDALEQGLLAHAFLYFAATSPVVRSTMYARGLDDITNLCRLGPRRPREHLWCAVWARVNWSLVWHGSAERSELLKNYSSAVFWASRAVYTCPRKSVRTELIASLLKPYTEGALRFADEHLRTTPPPTPAFRTELEKKRAEWRQIANTFQEK